MLINTRGWTNVGIILANHLQPLSNIKSTLFSAHRIQIRLRGDCSLFPPFCCFILYVLIYFLCEIIYCELNNFMCYSTTHVKGVYLTIMNPTCKGIVVNYGSQLFMMCMKTTKCPPVAALPLHFFSVIIK